MPVFGARESNRLVTANNRDSLSVTDLGDPYLPIEEAAPGTGSFTANAVLRRSFSASFTADAVITTGATVSASFTADAVLRRIFSASFTADAVKYKAVSATFTANAVRKAAIAASFTADAYIAFQLTADAVLKRNMTGSFTANAWIYAPRADPDGPGGPGETPLVSIMVDGVDITQDCVLSDATFTTVVNGGVGSCRVRVRDDDHTKNFTSGSEITVDIDGVRKFGGYILKPKRLLAFPVVDTTDPDDPSRFIVLEGVDYNILFGKRVLFDHSTPANVALRSWDAGSHDDVIIKYIFDHYTDLGADGVTYQGVTHVGSPNPDHKGVVGSGGLYFGDAMREINRLISAVWYIDPYKDLAFVDVDLPNADFGLSDRPVSGEVGYRELTQAEDATQMANDALVWGAGMGSSRMVFAREQDAASIAAHGRWQFGEFTTAIFRQTSVDSRADSIVNGTPQGKRGGKDDKESWQVVTYEKSFTVGQKVAIESEVFGKSDVVPIRRMTITFPTKSKPRFELVLSHEIDEPWNFYEFYFPDLVFGNLGNYPDIDIPTIDLPGECGDEVCGVTDGHNVLVTLISTAPLGGSDSDDISYSSDAGPLWQIFTDANASGSSEVTAQYVSTGDGIAKSIVSQYIGNGYGEVFAFMKLPFLESSFDVRTQIRAVEMDFTNATQADTPDVTVEFNGSRSGVVGFEYNYRDSLAAVGFRFYYDDNQGVLLDTEFALTLDPTKFYTFWIECDTGSEARFTIWAEDEEEPASPNATISLFGRPLWVAREYFQYLQSRFFPNPVVLYGPSEVWFGPLDITGIDRCSGNTFDMFNRVSSVGFGESTDGHDWDQTIVGTASSFVGDGQGTLRVNTSGDVLEKVDSTGPWAEPAWTMLARFTPSVALSGSNALALFFRARNSSGSTVALVEVDVSTGVGRILIDEDGDSDIAAKTTWVANIPYYVRWERDFFGTSRARIWDASDPEPSTWDVEVDADSTAIARWAVELTAIGTMGGNRDIDIDFIDFGYDGKPCFGDVTGDIIGPTADGCETATRVDSTHYRVTKKYLPGSTRVYVNGLFKRPGVDYTESSPDTGTILFGSSVSLSATVVICYIANGSL